MKQDDVRYFDLAIEQARKTMNDNIGGPFGAVVVDELGEVLSVASNSVLKDHDPTAHAEINAIRLASKKKGSHDLSGCTLYTTAFPCPMCLSAILWANIKEVRYGAIPEDADKIGFRDDFMYQFIEEGMKNDGVLKLVGKERTRCLTLFDEYAKKNKEIY